MGRQREGHVFEEETKGWDPRGSGGLTLVGQGAVRSGVSAHRASI